MSFRTYIRLAVCGLVAALPLSHASLGEDPRTQHLVEFFSSFDCPRPFHVSQYITAADAYGVDYRLLPVISVLESTCGKYQRHNNHWGWNSSRTQFPSVDVGIHFVTKQLAEGPFEDKALAHKLFAYNPYSAYVKKALRMIHRVETSPLE